MKRGYFRGASVMAVALAGLFARPALAAEAAADAGTSGSEVSEVVVTGSYIAGTPEDSALPVSVVNAEELAKQGSPTVVQLVKTLPAAAASIGESNRFLGSAAGTATINLRGFGSARTLVLLNGRRMATSAAPVAAGAIDINLMPTAAIGRIELLKEGSAATYGSDAVAGVVNFITRRDLDGFEFTGDYAYIRGGEGDYSVSGAWGSKFDRGNIMLTLGYRRRSEVRTTDRDWAIRPNAVNPFGGWSAASNPGQYATGNGGVLLPNGSLSQPFTGATTINDDGCTQLGGEIISGLCRFQYTRFDNLVNDEYHYQAYGELNFALSDTTKFHGEVLWVRHDVPNERVSPYQSTTQFPTPILASGASPGGGTSPYPATGLNQQSRFYIPFANPGLTQLYNTHCVGAPAVPYTLSQCNNIQNYGVITSQTFWRPGAYGGNPLFSDGADHQQRKTDAFRVSGDLSGKLPWMDWNWDVALTYMEIEGFFSTPDEIVNRVELAFRGLGGPSCNPATGTPGVGGCQWFNPFSNAVQRDAVYGMTNPFFSAAATPANTNTRELFDWMHDELTATNNSRLLVADAVINGELPISLPGGNVAVALGGQWRYDEFKSVANNPFYDINATPCVDDVDDHVPHCTGGTGPFDFYAAILPFSVDRDVKSLFAEIKLPIFDTLSADAAVRYEYYGGNIGSTTNPKLDVKWQIVPQLAVRGSIGTTFRAPAQTSITPGFTRGLAQFTDPTTGASLYRNVDTFNNPNLRPETADTYAVGAIVEIGNFNATLDWWRFKFKDELTTETASRVFATMFPSFPAGTPILTQAASWQCANAAFASRFTFASGPGTAVNPLTGTNCHPSNFLGVRNNLINGPDVDTSGIDFKAEYRVREFVWDSDLTVGVDGGYLIKYQRDPLVTIDGFQIEPALDRAGQAELLAAFYSYPRWKVNGFINWNKGVHNVRATLRYIGSMKDRNHDLDPATSGVQPATIESYIALDLVYRVELPWNTTVTATVQNVFDRDPPFAFSQYNYDYTIGNPLGRVFQINVRKRF